MFVASIFCVSLISAMRLLKRIRQWSMRLPSSWGRAHIHGSLLLTLVLFSLGLLFLSTTRPGFAEFRPLALTLPAIWVVSLAVRIAAQHLAIGAYSLELETRLGPSGNLSTEYEFMPPQQILRYALAGHAATAFLVLIGLIVSAVLVPGENSQMKLAALLDVHGGWTSLAWATQIMWVNLFIGAFNLLPTIPFDNRALMYSLAVRKRFGHEPQVLRRLAFFDSHLAAILLGCGISILLVTLLWDNDFHVAWYALIASAVYLFVASRWELSRACQIEEQYMPFESNRHAGHGPPKPHSRRHSHSKRESSRHARHTAPSEPTASNAKTDERRGADSEAYLDEILRKLHREGTGSLSLREQEALLSASQRLKEKRQKH